MKQVPIQANTELSIVKRQTCAKILLSEMSKGKRIINIDETWIGEMDFRRCKWRARGASNSLSSKGVQPRLSLIVAIDNFGELYMSLI